MWMSIKSAYLLKNSFRDYLSYALIGDMSTSTLHDMKEISVGQLQGRHPLKLSDVC